MKKNNLIFLFLAIFLIHACQEDEYLAPDDLSDVSWYTGIHPGALYAVNVGEYISFMDVSQGAISHEWTIEEGNNYLIPMFSENDSLPLFINNEMELTTTDTTIHVLFNNVGVNKVRLYNTFLDSVAYKGKVTYPAVKQGDVWVIDTTFIIDVYDEIDPAVEVYQDGVLVASVSENVFPEKEKERQTWDTVYVEAGASLTYVDITTVGRPTSRNWIVNGGRFSTSNSNDSVAEVHYYGLGSYTSSITASRGGDLPEAQTNKTIPMIVKVIQSSQPFIAVEGTFTENENEVVSFNVSGEIQPFAGEEDNFIVHVENTTAGFSQNIAVSEVSVNSSDATKIDLVLAENIYNTDVVTVSYSGGSIKSVDERTLEPFNPYEVEMYLTPNLLNESLAGFEEYHVDWKKAFCEGFWVGNKNGSESNPYWARVEGSASPTGQPVMSFTMPGGISEAVTLGFGGFAGMLSSPGTYQISYKIYIEPGSNLTQALTPVASPWTLIAWDLSNVEEGEWVTLKKVQTFDQTPTTRFEWKVGPVDNPDAGDVKLYLDDYSFILLEDRP